jgi:hypothetical protein
MGLYEKILNYLYEQRRLNNRITIGKLQTEFGQLGNIIEILSKVERLTRNQKKNK